MFCEVKHRAGRGKRRVEIEAINRLIRVPVLPLDGPDTRLVFLEWVHVYHPVENYWMKRASGCVAGALGRDGSAQTKLCMRPE
jgi:hypothetical protein